MPKFKYNPGDMLGPFDILMLERTEKKSGGHWYGKFQCPICNQKFETRISAVAQGVTKSCGCLQKINAKNQGYKNFVDLTGKRFGRLVCLYTTKEKTSNGSYIWHCKCDCGKTKDVSNSDLKSGKVKSCGCNYSKGEAQVEQCLKELNIQYISQYTFKDCLTDKKCLLRFDFYLPDYNCCIEYDGEQHFKYRKTGWNTEEHFKETQLRDSIKNKYCKNNNIKMIRIPYTDFNKISSNYILQKIL